MNLVTDPWIPVLHHDGDRRLVTLQQVFTEGSNYADLAVRPHERVALMRLLIAVAQAALDGPKDIGEWDSARERLPSAAAEYLKDVRDAFDLFHPTHPFLQIAELEECSEKETFVSKLDFALASGRGSTLFDHGGIPEVGEKQRERVFAPESLALMLLTYQNFSPSGGLPVARWGNIRTGQVGNPDAPCIPGSMCHSFLRKSNLRLTIHLNLICKDTITFSRYAGKWGKPVWECMPSGPEDTNAIENAIGTYLGRLVPVSRWIRLASDRTRMVCGKGFDYVSQGLFEPTSTIVVRNDTRSTLGTRPEKAYWRELGAILVKQRNDAGMGHGPLALANLGESEDCDLIVCSLIRNPGQQDIEDAVESVLFVPHKLRSPLGVARYEDEVKFSDGLSRRLESAVETWRKIIDGGWEGRVKNAANKGELLQMLRATAMRNFWTSVEKLRPLLLAHVNSLGESEETVEQTRLQWRKAVWRAAFDAYELSCAQDTPRQIRAYALGLRRLTGEANQGESNAEQEKETTEA